MFDCHHKTPGSYALVFCSHDLNAWNRLSKGLFTWSGGPRSSGVSFFLFSRSGGHKTKETYPTRPGSPTPCKQALINIIGLIHHFHIDHNAPCFTPKFCITIVSNFSWVLYCRVNKVHYGMCECGECIVNKLFLAQFTLLSP